MTEPVEGSAEWFGVETMADPPYKMVLVRWRDACISEDQHAAKDLVKDPLILTHTLGYLVQESEAFFSVAFSLHVENGDWWMDKVMHIPKCLITHVCFVAVEPPS